MTFININRKNVIMTSTVICAYCFIRLFISVDQRLDPPYINFTTNFTYPLDIDMVKLVSDYRKGHVVDADVINPFPYRFIKNPSHKCNLSEAEVKVQNKVFVLFMVKSAYENRRLRDAIRQTWGNERYLTHFNIKTVFTVGLPKANSRLDLIKNESDQMQDIIQVDYIDTYFNNTLKMIAEINWAVKFCQNAKYVVLIDDDYFVSPESLVGLLEYSTEIGHTKRLYMGYKHTNSKPRREKENKWRVSYSEYPFDMYPDFINAGTIIMSMEFVIEAQIAMMYTKLFRLDDIYLAIVARKLRVAPLGTKRVFGTNVMPWDIFNFEFLATAHHYKPTDLLWLWRRRRRRKHPDMRPLSI